MTLAIRLTMFLLAALGLVLLGFSASLYLLAAKYLDRQADERLESALNTLAAAAEINEDGVEWEPGERSLSFGRRTIEGSFAWRVGDERGRRLDGSANAGPLLDDGTPGQVQTRRTQRIVDRRGGRWEVAHRRLGSPARDRPALAAGPERTGTYNVVVLTAAVSLEGIHDTLFNLAVVLAGLSAGVWTIGLVGGHWFCRRALRPVTAMAAAARAIAGDDPGRRLPAPATSDELGELGRSFNALLDRLQESFERQRRFTGDASHQLRTPLTAVQGQVDLALRQERPAEEYRRVLALVQRRTRHLRQIVETLLFLARPDAEGLRPDLEPLDISSWLADHLRAWPDPRGASDLRWEQRSEAPLYVRAQPPLLGELLDNLLDNAGKYSEPGTPIVVSLQRDGPSVLLAVADRGIGIARDELPHLFEPFHRSEEARRRGCAGVGLGLSVARRLAHSLGGTLEVQSEPGGGSRFTLRLPVDPPAP